MVSRLLRSVLSVTWEPDKQSVLVSSPFNRIIRMFHILCCILCSATRRDTSREAHFQDARSEIAGVVTALVPYEGNGAVSRRRGFTSERVVRTLVVPSDLAPPLASTLSTVASLHVRFKSHRYEVRCAYFPCPCQLTLD